MDKKLQLIQHLYGEADSGSPLRDLIADEDLNQEYQELSEAKFWLDHAGKERPDKAVMAHILEAAAASSQVEDQTNATVANNTVHSPTNNIQEQDSQDLGSSSAPRNLHESLKTTSRQFNADRTPLARKQEKKRRRWAPVMAAFTLIATIGIGYQFLSGSQSGLLDSNNEAVLLQQAPRASEPMVESLANDLEKKESSELESRGFFTQEKALAPAAADFADEDFASKDLAITSVAGARGLSLADTSLPEWNDDMDRILRVQRRIETLLENNQDLGWDEATIPLEALPTNRPRNSALQQAGSRSVNNGNQ